MPSTKRAAEKQCFHCLDNIPPFTNITENIDGQQRYFCCVGCLSASQFIHSVDLDDFYKRRELSRHHGARQGTAELGNIENWAFLDKQDTAKLYVANTANKRELHLKIRGLYCASCGWLIARGLEQLSSSIELLLDSAVGLARLYISDDKIPLSQAVHLIEQLGYEPELIRLDDSGVDRFAYLTQQRRQAIKRIAVAGLGMMQVMTYAFGLYFGESQGISDEFHRFFSLVSMLVATVVVFYSGRPFFENAINDLKNFRLGMDVPIALAIGGAYFPSVYQTLFRQSDFVYFDSAVMFVFFLSVARFIEQQTRLRASSLTISAMQSMPSYLKVQRQQAGQPQQLELTPQQIQQHDEFNLGAGQAIPCDAIIISGDARIDESSLTGEVTPLKRKTDDAVTAGAKLLNGSLTVKATASFENSSIANLEKVLRQSQASKVSETQHQSKYVQHFVLLVLALTTIAGIFWWFYQPDQVFQICLAMLVASCPCAFALANPMGIVVASNSLRKIGVLLKNSDALATLTQLNAWVFDKTGTLTQGKPSIQQLVTHNGFEKDQCLAIAAAIELDVQHPIATAFSQYQSNLEASNVEILAGEGVSATVDGEQYFLGKLDWVSQHTKRATLGAAKDATKQSATLMHVALANSQQLIAEFYIYDALKPESKDLFTELERRGYQRWIMSGDHQASVAEAVADLPLTDYFADLKPQQKLKKLEKLQQNNSLAMVGDGINDALVLSKADVSIAMSNAADINFQQADLILLNGQLQNLCKTVDIARRTQSIIRQNLRWALMYNVLVLPLAAVGLLVPWLAALGMSLSSLLVVFNALRIGSIVKNK